MNIRLRSNLKNVILELYGKYRIRRSRKNEINKISDQRRQNILGKVHLTEDQIKKVNELYINNYGEKVSLDWHKYFTAYTGNFDENFFPELLFIPEFEHFMNINKDYSKAIEDKNLLPLIAKSVGIKTPEILLSCCYGLYRDNNYSLLSKIEFTNKLSNLGKVFIKPSVDSDSGSDCFIANFRNGIDTLTNKKAEDVLSNLGSNFVIQEVISCHESIKEIYPKSVNTFRIITYRWNNKIEAMPVIMRIGRGNANIDNAHAGGIFIALDNDGILHKTAFTEFCDKFNEHPDTKLIFEGHKIVGVEKVIEAAKRMHQALPQLGSYNWDFTIDEDGEPVLIEANVNGGSIWLIEMAHGKGGFGENTKDVLKWIREMKSLKLEDRKNEFEKI
ncbi:hypothetical protein NH288_02070 [Anaerococcus sp. NML200537]|uniref:sugar-transfer associated ATP-grasp domain-containing protein n=1 Tax=Anaerococcus sp. NML200537 TaxID=2954485 RepID=UPI002238C35D|nr:sugar-transfer associated ATP-grasp domain-containing protein [Anaerococcus sp. NML200537]MCW6700876.1 hypothetical protein [Anaerococcus sp. NML200537]